MIYYFLYSASLVLFWGLLFLDSNSAGYLGVFMGLTYTFYSSFIIRQSVLKETFTLKLIKLFGPVFYVVSNIIINRFDLYSIVHPINIAFIIFLIAFFQKGKFPSKVLQFFILSFIYLYSFTIYEKWEGNIFNKNSVYDFSVSKKSYVNNVAKLDSFTFLNSELDTISLLPNDKFTIIETWNEKCAPCMHAISGMQNFYKSIDKYCNQYYVYEKNKYVKYLDFSKVFGFKKINKKEKILIDIDLYKFLNLNGYPYFLLFDKRGKLIYTQNGYSDDIKLELQDSLLKYINYN